MTRNNITLFPYGQGTTTQAYQARPKTFPVPAHYAHSQSNAIPQLSKQTEFPLYKYENIHLSSAKFSMIDNSLGNQKNTRYALTYSSAHLDKKDVYVCACVCMTHERLPVSTACTVHVCTCAHVHECDHQRYPLLEQKHARQWQDTADS